MPAFNRQKTLQDALETKIRRAKTMAKAQKPTYKLKYPDETRDANQGNYTKLINRVTKEVNEKQEQHRKFTETLHKKID